jgi:hypothetical protein
MYVYINLHIDIYIYIYIYILYVTHIFMNFYRVMQSWADAEWFLNKPDVRIHIYLHLCICVYYVKIYA